MSSRCKHTSLSECHPVSIWACKPVSLLPCEGVSVWDRVSMSVQIRVHVTFLLAYGPVIVSACHPVSVSQSSTIKYVIVFSGCQHVSMQVYQPVSVNLKSAYKLCPSTCARNGSLSISVRASNVALMNAMPRQHESRFFKTASLSFFFTRIYLFINLQTYPRGLDNSQSKLLYEVQNRPSFRTKPEAICSPKLYLFETALQSVLLIANGFASSYQRLKLDISLAIYLRVANSLPGFVWRRPDMWFFYKKVPRPHSKPR